MEYKIRDFYQASILKSLGYTFLRLEPSEDNRYFFFVFDDPLSTAKSVSAGYWDHTIEVNAYAFVTAIKELKQQLFSVKNQGK